MVEILTSNIKLETCSLVPFRLDPDTGENYAEQ